MCGADGLQVPAVPGPGPGVHPGEEHSRQQEAPHHLQGEHKLSFRFSRSVSDPEESIFKSPSGSGTVFDIRIRIQQDFHLVKAFEKMCILYQNPDPDADPYCKKNLDPDS